MKLTVCHPVCPSDVLEEDTIEHIADASKKVIADNEILKKKLYIAMKALEKASTETERGFITTCALCGSPVKFYGYNPAWVCEEALKQIEEIK